MNEVENTMPRNDGVLKKLRLFFRCLLAFDLILLAVFLGGYILGTGRLTHVVGALGQVSLVSSMLLLNKVQLSQYGTKSNRVACLVLSMFFLVCFLVLLGFQIAAM